MMGRWLTDMADELERAGNAIDAIIGWLEGDGVTDAAVDGLTDVMETLLGAAPRLREMAVLR